MKGLFVKTARLVTLFGGILVVPLLHAQTTVDCNHIHPPKENVICIKNDYEKMVKNLPDVIALGPKLIKDGDRYFKKKNYFKAFKAYDLAYSNMPNAYSYLRKGDVIFLSVATGTDFRDENGKATGACLLPGKFVWTVDGAVMEEYQTGIELYKILKAGPPVSDAMLADAQKKSQCLTALADQYRQVKTGCVDLAKVRSCMGIL